MIASLKIKNFKCFEDIKINNLKRINILVGENASGKTSLLEALYLLGSGSPSNVLKLLAWRGVGEQGRFRFNPKEFFAIWRHLFYHFDEKNTATIEVKGRKGAERKLLQISTSKEEMEELIIDHSSEEGVSAIPKINFRWESEDGKIFSTHPEWNPDELKFKSFAGLFDLAFYSAFHTPSPIENAERFSQLSRMKEDAAIVKIMNKEFNFIEDLSIELQGGIPTIFASSTFLKEKSPIGTISSGINKLMSLLLAIASFKNGLVLIDELENGIYYERLPNVWRILLDASKYYGTQIFISTHSWECLRGTMAILKDNVNDFCLLRTERDGKSVRVSQFRGKNMLAALEQDMELR